MSPEPLPDFHHALSLSRGGLEAADLAECHGVLCGMICSEDGSSANKFLDYLASLQLTVEPGTGLYDIMLEAVTSTHDQLDDDDLGFRLWLPDDDQSLDQRTDALAQWCTGFLAGLGMQGNLPDLSPEASEALEDVQQIARAALSEPVGAEESAVTTSETPDAADPNEEDEKAFFEIVEYVRVVALLLREELRGPRENEPIH